MGEQRSIIRGFLMSDMVLDVPTFQVGSPLSMEKIVYQSRVCTRGFNGNVWNKVLACVRVWERVANNLFTYLYYIITTGIHISVKFNFNIKHQGKILCFWIRVHINIRRIQLKSDIGQNKKTTCLITYNIILHLYINHWFATKINLVILIIHSYLTSKWVMNFPSTSHRHVVCSLKVL